MSYGKIIKLYVKDFESKFKPKSFIVRSIAGPAIKNNNQKKQEVIRKKRGEEFNEGW
jgi:hypothetical protein